MRPMTLAFKGLRSYTERQTIDFTGKEFIAIIGDTGAGKSTVLDAMCYALCNRCSWHGGTVTDLVAHGGDGTLSVELTFSIGNRVWCVERSITPRGGAPTHKLTSVETGEIVTGAQAVTAEIRRIIGLDYDTFLRAVILPQGRFQELLRMGHSDRTKILKSILGLDQLSTVREHALTLQTRLAARLAIYKERRAAFLPNPATTLSEATQRQKTAQVRVDTFQTARSAVSEAATAASEASTRLAAIEQARHRLASAIPDRVDAQYQAMLAAAADISQRREETELLRREAHAEQRRVQGELDKADLEGSGIAAVASAISTLTTLADRLPQLDAQAARLRSDGLQLQIEKTDLEQRRTALHELEEAARMSRLVAEEASSRVGVVTEDHRVAHGTLSELRQALAAVRETEQTFSAREQETEQLKAAARTAAAEAEGAERALAAAEAEQARSAKLHASATAAEGCNPGDPCPVCTRRLPTDFIAPADDTINHVAAAVKAARKTASKADSNATTALERARIAEQDTLPAAAEKMTTASGDLERATAAARAVFGAVDLNTSDDELLRRFADAVHTASAEHDQAVVLHRAAHDKHTRAESELPVLEGAHTQREATFTAETANHENALIALRRAADTLPEPFRTEELSLHDIGRQRAAAQQRQDELKTLADQLTTLQATFDELRAAERQLEEAHAAKVIQPANALRHRLDTLTDRLSDAEAILGIDQHQQRPAKPTLADEASWSVAVTLNATELLDRCSQAATDARRTGEVAREAAEQARRGCGADNDTHLEQLHMAANNAFANASRAIAKATAHQPLTDELDRRIGTAEPTVAALADLVALLADGKFMASAVRQRQQALLGAASVTLLEVSGGRFGFADNFRIIDTDTAQPRDVKTLSGGETFQASLALALAVVELASRASGRVDALFLDEGFGSLDSGVLQDALNALAAHSTAGRLVTVISHMRSLTEIADHVLVVTRTFTGSRAHWASTEEREQIINDDLGRGLLA